MERELDKWHKLHKFYMGDYQTKDLAQYLKVSSRTIQRWLNEKTKPSEAQLTLIKKYLAEKESKASL